MNCSCVVCRKEVSTRGISAHFRIVHLGDKPALGNRNFPAWNKGLTKESHPALSVSALKSAATASARGTNRGENRRLSAETKKKLSIIMTDRYANGWEPTCGRSKKYKWESPVAGQISVDGTWELIVCKYLDNLGVQWERNRKRFPYVKDGKIRTYQPDFYVSDWDTFIEVKGYQTDLDECKWSQFPATLVVWKREKIKELENELDRV